MCFHLLEEIAYHDFSGSDWLANPYQIPLGSNWFGWFPPLNIVVLSSCRHQLVRDGIMAFDTSAAAFVTARAAFAAAFSLEETAPTIYLEVNC